MEAKKLYYKIGEACRTLDIQPYVLRYWETEFAVLSPNKSKSGQRVYTEEELAIIRRIKELLYGEGYTIAGAKKKLESELQTGGVAPPAGAPQGVGGAEAKRERPRPAVTAKAKMVPAAEVASGAAAAAMESLRERIARVLGEAREILGLLEKA